MLPSSTSRFVAELGMMSADLGGGDSAMSIVLVG
jgi:hypothetical protein